MSTCCRGCEKRYLGCHDHCEDYKAFKAEIEERKRREKEFRSPINYKIDRVSTEAERKRRKLHYE